MIPPRTVAMAAIHGTDAPWLRHVPPGIRSGHGREAPPLPPPLAVA